MKRFFKLFTIIFITMITLHVLADEGSAKKPLGPRPKLTAEQEACMKNKDVSGLPAGDLKPTHEEMLTAMTKCSIKVDQTIEELREKYSASSDDDARDSVKADMRTIFYATESNDVKQKVRAFFRDYRDQGSDSSTHAARAPASATK